MSLKIDLALLVSMAVLAAGVTLGGAGVSCSSAPAGGDGCADEEAEGIDCSCDEDDFYAPSCVDGEWVCDECGEPSPHVPCGSYTGETCPDSEYCVYDDGLCGAGQAGECRSAPAKAPTGSGDPACGCDGKVYDDWHWAAFMRVDTAFGGCSAPPGTFACGDVFCSSADQYCERVTYSMNGGKDGFTCRSDTGCVGMPVCACMEQQYCGFPECMDEGGHAVVMCEPF